MKKHVKPNPMKGTTGGVVDKTMPIHQSQRRDLQRRDRQGRPRRHQAAERGREHAQDRTTACASSSPAAKRSRRKRLPWLNNKLRSSPRRRWPDSGHLPRKDRAGPGREVRLQVDDAGAAPDQDHAQHGRERGGRRQEGHGQRRRRPDQDRRPEAGGHQVARRRSPDFKIRDNVPIGCMVTLRGVQMYEFLDRFVTDRAAARARLPRHLGSCVRRPRQLQHRRQGTDHLPRDRLRQDRRAARPEHQHHDDREERRRVQGAARRIQVSRSRTEVARG